MKRKKKVDAKAAAFRESMYYALAMLMDVDAPDKHVLEAIRTLEEDAPGCDLDALKLVAGKAANGLKRVREPSKEVSAARGVLISAIKQANRKRFGCIQLLAYALGVLAFLSMLSALFGEMDPP